MIGTVGQIINLLLLYKYIILFPLAIVEGPIVTIIAGLLVTLGVLNVFFVYPILVVGDVIGDTSGYILGRWCAPLINRYGAKIGLTETKLNQVKNYFHDHRKKALFLSKVLHGIGFMGLIVAGILKIPYRKFFLTCFITSILQSLLLLIVGVLFGQAYVLIATYLNYYVAAAFIVVSFIGIFIFIRRFNIIKY